MQRITYQIALIGMALLMTVADGAKAYSQATYALPPKDIIEIIDVKPDPAMFWSSNTQWAVLADRDSMPDVADLARRMLSLAGFRIDPTANGRFQSDFYRGLTLRDRSGQISIPIPLPADAKVGSVAWSHRSTGFVFTLIKDHGTELWYMAVSPPNQPQDTNQSQDTSQPQRLTDRLSTVLQGLDWMPDGERVFCCEVPESRGPEPTAPVVPFGPSIQESTGTKAPARTYQDLLTNAYDEALFEHFATTQLVILGPKSPKLRISQGLIDMAAISPDGQHFLLTRLSKPFSYLLPSDFFPRTIDVIDLQGTSLFRVADVPLSENIPIEGVRTGPRSIQWWPGAPARLVWTEALDGGDPKNKVEHREQLWFLDAPFRTPANGLLKLQGRFSGLTFFTNPSMFLTTESDRDRRWTTAMLHDMDAPNSPPKVFFDRSVRDRYADPGRVMVKPDTNGFPVAKQTGDSIFLAGVGASPKGNRPFLDRRSLETFETERLWRCSSEFSENVTAIVDVDGDKLQFITRRESVSSSPNYFLKDLNSKNETQLTHFVDPTPQLRGIQKRIVKYQRADGVPLSATLYLPANYEPGTRLPLIVWAYPLEFNDASTAGQIFANPNEFTRIGGISHLSLLTQGYAIMDDATMPVIGDPETMNDTFIDQIVGAAAAAIDHAVELGVADRNRVGIGGHSYGAFMTANLLAHSQLFQAGVARSGAYNRTLTPFGFQSERRALWEAKDVYSNISPFMHADKIKTPILFIHGENDNNSGTFPIQSQRMFQAVKGNGGVTRLVMLPYESHGYRGRQSILHTQAEMVQWFNRYVRDAQPPTP